MTFCTCRALPGLSSRGVASTLMINAEAQCPILDVPTSRSCRASVTTAPLRLKHVIVLIYFFIYRSLVNRSCSPSGARLISAATGGYAWNSNDEARKRRGVCVAGRKGFRHHTSRPDEMRRAEANGCYRKMWISHLGCLDIQQRGRALFGTFSPSHRCSADGWVWIKINWSTTKWSIQWNGPKTNPSKDPSVVCQESASRSRSVLHAALAGRLCDCAPAHHRCSFILVPVT